MRGVGDAIEDGMPQCEIGDRFSTILDFFSSRRRHTRYWRDWSSDVCSSDLCRPPESSRAWSARQRRPGSPRIAGLGRCIGACHGGRWVSQSKRGGRFSYLSGAGENTETPAPTDEGSGQENVGETLVEGEEARDTTDSIGDGGEGRR